LQRISWRSSKTLTAEGGKMQRESLMANRTVVIAFFATVVIGGANFIAVKFSNAELEPLYGAAVRFAAATLILFALARLRRMELPRGKAAVGAIVYGLLNFGLAYALLYFALVRVAAGTISIVLATVPLVTLVLAVLHRQETLTMRGVVGGGLAVAGITVLSLRSLGGELPLVHMLAAVGAVFAVAESSVLVKGFPKSDPITTNAVGMGAGAAALAAASLLFREQWTVPHMTRTWLVLIWLAGLGSVGLFGLFLFVIKRWTASATVYALTLMPVVAVTLGVLLADERITAEVVIGGGLVVLAVYVGALQHPRPDQVRWAWRRSKQKRARASFFP
jgi:drug/metabolite transporter (DMT)-like permease